MVMPHVARNGKTLGRRGSKTPEKRVTVLYVHGGVKTLASVYPPFGPEDALLKCTLPLLAYSVRSSTHCKQITPAPKVDLSHTYPYGIHCV